MRHFLRVMSCPLMLLFVACDRQSNNASSTAPATQSTASAEKSNVADDSSKVTLAFEDVDLEDIAPFLQQHSGKQVTIDPQFTRMRPKYRLRLVSEDVITRDEGFSRILAKFRADGLEVLESEDSIEINLGTCLSVWKPEWQREFERTRPGSKFDPPVIDPEEPEGVETDEHAAAPPALSKEQVDRMDKVQARNSLVQVVTARKQARDPELQERLKREFSWLIGRLRELEQD